MSEPASVAVK
uniref:Uncharacterized protein n=1 Tax=Anguilla anguilla TaxID=7936 RepID=A0A0E9U996_ANGAN